MTYTTVNELFWAVAGLIVVLLAVIAGLAASLLWARSRRFKDLARTRDLRRDLIDGGRDARAMEDTCWYLLRESDARLARLISDAKGAARVARDARVRRRSFALVSDLHEAL